MIFNLKENIYMIKGKEKEKNIIIMIYQNMKENLGKGKEIEKVKNIMIMVN